MNQMTDQDFESLLMSFHRGGLTQHVPTATKTIFGNFRDWCAAVWESKQGQTVPVPPQLKIQDAAALVSIICEYKAKQQQKTGEIPIRRVAEIRGSRFNTGKLRMDLIDPQAMKGLAAVLTKGAEKYSANNWRDGLPYTETVASLLRHTFAFLGGEDIDSETGLPHVDHMQCNAMFLSWMTKNRKDMDDRWKQQQDIDWQAAARKAFPSDGKSS